MPTQIVVLVVAVLVLGIGMTIAVGVFTIRARHAPMRAARAGFDDLLQRLPIVRDGDSLIYEGYALDVSGDSPTIRLGRRGGAKLDETLKLESTAAGGGLAFDVFEPKPLPTFDTGNPELDRYFKQRTASPDTAQKFARNPAHVEAIARVVAKWRGKIGGLTISGRPGSVSTVLAQGQAATRFAYLPLADFEAILPDLVAIMRAVEAIAGVPATTATATPAGPAGPAGPASVDLGNPAARFLQPLVQAVGAELHETSRRNIEGRADIDGREVGFVLDTTSNALMMSVALRRNLGSWTLAYEESPDPSSEHVAQHVGLQAVGRQDAAAVLDALAPPDRERLLSFIPEAMLYSFNVDGASVAVTYRVPTTQLDAQRIPEHARRLAAIATLLDPP